MKNNGNPKSFKTGFTKVFKNPKIIHPSKYVFHPSIPAGKTTTASGWDGVFSKYAMINNIEAFNKMEKNIFIIVPLMNKFLIVYTQFFLKFKYFHQSLGFF